MRIVLRTASRGDFPAVAALWTEAFGDPAEAVSDFFAAFPGCVSYVAEAGGEIVSMVHALPQVLSPDVPAAYLYAVATLRRCRGQGLCRALMDFAERDLRRRGFRCAVLTPGEPGLFRFYAGLGYATDFFRRRTPFRGGTPVSAEEYARLRETVLSVPHMVYDVPTLEYAQRVYGLTFYRTPTGCAAAGAAGAAEVLPEDCGGDPFAMMKWLDEPGKPQNAYLGFALE